jgi:hypothetical protein
MIPRCWTMQHCQRNLGKVSRSSVLKWNCWIYITTCWGQRNLGKVSRSSVLKWNYWIYITTCWGQRNLGKVQTFWIFFSFCWTEVQHPGIFCWTLWIFAGPTFFM